MTIGKLLACDAGIAQLVEHVLAKHKVAGSTPVSRSNSYRLLKGSFSQ